MKILLSPSKTQNIKNDTPVTLEQPIFLNESQKLVEQIQSLSDQALIQTLHIPKTQQEKVIELYRNFGQLSGSAIESYTGEAFKYLKANVDVKEMEMFRDRLYIFSALYGLLRPFDKISPYRLDMTMSIFDKQSLMNFWKVPINQLLEKETEILSLASQEFEKIIEVPYTKVAFLKSDGTRVHTVLAKQMRGMMAQYVVKHNLLSIAEVKDIQLNGFVYKEQINQTLCFHLENE